MHRRLRAAGSAVLPLKSFSFPGFSVVGVDSGRRARASRACPVLSRSPAPIRASLERAHDVRLDVGSRFGRNAAGGACTHGASREAHWVKAQPCRAEQRSTLRPKRTVLESPFEFWLRVKGYTSLRWAGRAFDHPAQFGGGGPAGAPAPQVNGQLAGQRYGDFLFQRGPVFELLQKFLSGVPEGLPA